jgi:1-phosphofructokinase family hexose kinase
MTLVVCPNLAIDRVVVAPTLAPGTITRARLLRQQAGGKGANVLRALRALGGDGVLAGFAAGDAGELFAALAAREGLDTALVRVAGETRLSTVVLTQTAAATRLYEYGPSLDEGDEAALHDALRGLPADDEWAAVTGAAPPGAAPGFYAALCRTLRDCGRRVLLDAADEQLALAAREAPDIVKVNLEEAASAVGDIAAAEPPIDAPRAGGGGPAGDEALVGRGLALAAALAEGGAALVVVTLGAPGAVALGAGGAWHVSTPAVEVVNTTGSGDCFAGALMLALAQGERTEAALAAAAGAAAANAADPVTGRFDPALAHTLAAGATVRPLPLPTPGPRP